MKSSGPSLHPRTNQSEKQRGQGWMASWTVGISMGFDDDRHGSDASHSKKTSNFHCVFDLVVIPLEEGTSFVWVGSLSRSNSLYCSSHLARLSSFGD